MKSKIKYIIMLLLIILITTTIITSYHGFLFFSPGFNEFDYLMLNILGDALLVGIVTHISSKSITLYISKKEFERNNKINITMSESRNTIINYESFMNIYQNNDSFFALEKKDQDVVDYVYKLYDYFLKTLKCDGVEKQLLDTILNIPFFIKYYSDDSVVESYRDILEKFDSKNKYNNISILKEILSEEDINMIQEFSKIILDIKHYTIINLNNVEGCQLLITSDGKVACKIPCLPNHSYDLYMYYNKEHYIETLAFSFDFDSKEYATKLLGFKYSNSDVKIKPVRINLKDFIDIK